MAYEELPVSPALITWARTRAGVTVAEAAQTFKKIQAWEDGASAPTYPQLEQLADAYKVPIAVFFFPEPPTLPPIGETFRTLPMAQFEKIPSKIRFLLRKAKALQLNLIELTDGRNTSEKQIVRDLSFSPQMSLREMSTRVREYLGVSLDDQQKWPDDDTALKRWREALFKVGIYVFKDAFRVDEFSGFCLYHEVFPLIYVNNSSTKTRQIFTLFHELAHLLFHTSGIDTLNDEFLPQLENDARRIEILCNGFAAEFLLPEDALSAAVQGYPAIEATAEMIAASFHVSREVVFRRFLDRDMINQRIYNEATTRWANQRHGGGSGGDYYWTKLAYLGPDYVALALSQYRRNRIDETQLAEYLDMKPKNLAAIEDYFARSGA